MGDYFFPENGEKSPPAPTLEEALQLAGATSPGHYPGWYKQATMSVGGYFSSWFLAGMSIALCMAVVGAVPGSNLFDAATGNMVESSTACGAKGCISKLLST